MAKKQQSEGFWPRMVITLVVVVWIAVLGGNWLGRVIVEKEGSGESSSQTQMNMPVQKAKPWVNSGAELQKEVDQRSSQGSGSADADADNPVVVAPVAPTAPDAPATASTPEAAATKEAAIKQPQSDELTEADRQRELEMLDDSDPLPTPAAGNNPLPTPALQDKALVLQFGAFKDKNHASGIVSRLAAQGFAAEITPVKTESGNVYRVNSKPLSDVETARAKVEELKSLGFDVFLAE